MSTTSIKPTFRVKVVTGKERGKSSQSSTSDFVVVNVLSAETAKQVPDFEKVTPTKVFTSIVKVTPTKEHFEILKGIPITGVKEVAGQLGLKWDDLAQRCGLSRSTYRRKLKQRSWRLNELESDTLARYARLNAKAQEVFEGDEKASRNWLHTPQPGLGNVVPLEFARTTVGYREVEKLLTRIDLGVYA
jgi:putative toxin-antitoxin system antitoxin component (TIGR02293 family)